MGADFLLGIFLLDIYCVLLKRSLFFSRVVLPHAGGLDGGFDGGLGRVRSL